MTAPSLPDMRPAQRDLVRALGRVQRAFHEMGVQLRAAVNGETVHRAGLRGPRRPWESRADVARRHREHSYLRRRDRRTKRG